MRTAQETVGIIGDGGWGTSLALLLCKKKYRVMMWSAFPEYAAVMRKKHENVKYLPGFKLPRTLRITTDLAEMIRQSSVLVVAVPTQFIRRVLERLPQMDVSHTIFVNVAKGIEVSSLETPTAIIHSCTPGAHCAVLSGPSHAEEVAQGTPTCVVVACEDVDASVRLQQMFMTPTFRIYTARDLTGVELGGAIKNVMAIAAGMCDGLNYGANTKAALISRGLQEMMTLGVKMGARPETFAGLAGLGDLITTCFSPYGRNRAVGEQLARGKTIKQITAHMSMVAEGVATSEAIRKLADKYHVEMPICREVHRVIYAGKSPRSALKELMMRAPKPEMKH